VQALNELLDLWDSRLPDPFISAVLRFRVCGFDRWAWVAVYCTTWAYLSPFTSLIPLLGDSTPMIDSLDHLCSVNIFFLPKGLFSTL
jgi:hypothetical protein